jgi:hypothetical protein
MLHSVFKRKPTDGLLIYFGLLAGLATALLLAAPTLAQDLRGRLEVTGLGSTNTNTSLDNSLGHQTFFDGYGNARVMWEPSFSDFDFTFHYKLSAHAGQGVDLANKMAALSPAPPPATLFDLKGTLVSNPDLLVTHEIDRLALGYSSDNFVVRVGRQALTWGPGMVFHPLDLVDPFAPNTVDTEYKPGVDMVYGQYLFDNGSTLDAIAVPRAPNYGASPTWDDSTFALKYAGSFGDIGTTLTLARDRGDIVTGFGLSGPVGDATWNAELIPVFEKGGTVRISALANISAGVMIADHNATVFAEYFHNGFGVTGSGTPLSALPTDLTDRITRGQLFTTSQDYVALGGTYEANPLLTVSPSIIVDLNDFSVDLAAQANWSLGDNTNLIFGANIPLGASGTEFGGRPLTPGSTTYAAPSKTAYVQLRQYF